jgi:hypothetical protein
MLKEEFEKLAGFSVRPDVYAKIESAYMESGKPKDAFVESLGAKEVAEAFGEALDEREARIKKLRRELKTETDWCDKRIEELNNIANYYAEELRRSKKSSEELKGRLLDRCEYYRDHMLAFEDGMNAKLERLASRAIDAVRRMDGEECKYSNGERIMSLWSALDAQLSLACDALDIDRRLPHGELEAALSRHLRPIWLQAADKRARESEKPGQEPASAIKKLAAAPGVYKYSQQLALEHGEAGEFDASRALDKACAKALAEKIDKAAADHGDPGRADAVKAVMDAIGEFGFDRVSWVTACALHHHPGFELPGVSYTTFTNWAKTRALPSDCEDPEAWSAFHCRASINALDEIMEGGCRAWAGY